MGGGCDGEVVGAHPGRPRDRQGQSTQVVGLTHRLRIVACAWSEGEGDEETQRRRNSAAPASAAGSASGLGAKRRRR